MTTKITTSNIESTTLTSLGGPKISTIVYPGTETATDPAGGETITINGTGFNTGFSIIVGSTSASVTTYVSSTQVTFTAPAATAGTYVLYLINTDGGTAISIPGLSYSGVPTWSTAAGSLGTIYETTSISTTVVATGDVPITYSLYSGTLPTGSTLSSGGLLSGTAPTTASATTYSFTIAAKDAQNQTTNRAFSVTLNPDVVTWSSPANNTTYSVFTDTAIANVTMSATSAGSGSITYTANALPTGLSITGANIAGTPTVAASSSTLLTATSSINSRAATRTINWVVTVSNDTYFKNTTLLLNGETTNTPFISDASTNSFALTINGDTKPVLFNPYTPGYYSNYFDGTGDYLTIPDNNVLDLSTNDFTIEFWVYPITGINDVDGLISKRPTSTFTGGDWRIAYRSATSAVGIAVGTNNVDRSTPAITINNWNHIAFVRSSGTLSCYANGVRGDSLTWTENLDNTNDLLIGLNTTSYDFIGYISNVRILKGTALYSGATYTVPTSPLTAIANTSLLTCQSNRFIDNSTNAFTITKNGDVSVSPNIPFTQNASYSTYGSTYFDGTGDYLTTSDNTAFQFGTGDFTVEAWVYLSVVNSSQRRFWSYQASGSSTVFWVGTSTTNKFSTEMRGSSGTGDTQIYSTTTPVANTWYHVAFTRSGTTTYLFVNGTLETTTTGQNQNIASGGTPNIGQHNSLDYWYGYIADLRIVKGTAVYTSTFTPPASPLTAIANTSLLTLQYNGGANNSGIVDNSPFNNIITRNGNASQGTFSPYSQTGWSTYFSGAGNYFQTPASSASTIVGTLSSTANLTIECWIYPIAYNSSANFPGLIGDMVATTENNNWSWGITNTGTLMIYWNVSGSQLRATSTNTVSLNTWTHIALNVASGAITMYINGVSQSLSGTTTLSTPTSSNGYLVIGQWNNGSGGTGGTSHGLYTGYISNLRVVKASTYTSGFTSSTSPLIPITNTSLLICQSNRFVENSANNIALTIGGTPSVQAFSPFGSISEATPISYSNYFDGTGDYFYSSASSANAMGTGDYTVEAWIYVTAAFGTTGSGRGAIISNRGQESATTSFMLQHYNGKIYFGTSNVDVIVGNTTMSINTWYHVAITRSSGTVRLFLNGVSDATAVTGNSTNHSDTNAFYVGIDGAYDRYPFTGYISNARLVKGTAVYTSAFTPSTTPLTAISGTSLLTCQSTRIIDNSANAFTLTAAGDVKPRIFNPFGYTAQSAISYTPSLHGGSAYFDGTGDNLTTPNISSWQFGTGDFTVEFWVYPKGNGTIVGLTTSGAGTGYWNAIMSSGNFYWASGVVFRGTSGIDYTNAWHHFAYVRSSGTSKMYIDGINQSSGADSTNYNATVGTLTIGSGDSYGTMTAYISDLRITKGTSLYTSNFVPPTQTIGNYSTSYPSQLLLNFNNGGVIDQHGTNVLETLGNAQLSTAIKKYNNASMYFDGTGDYLSIPLTQNFQFETGDFTIECWNYMVARTNSYPAIFSNYNSYTSGAIALFAGHGSGTTTAYQVALNGSSFPVIQGGTISYNTWVHLAVVRSSGTISLYVNGTSVGSSNSSGITYNGVGSIFYIGSTGDALSTGYINGYIDDFRITKGYARYTANFTAPTSAFITK